MRISNILRKIQSLFLFIIIFSMISACSGEKAGPRYQYQVPTEIGDGWETASSGCSIFTVSKGEQVFFGGNDDSNKSDSYYWVDPGGSQGYGAIWIGYPDNVQQGVNEKGLAYDANGLPRVDVNPHRERKSVLGGYSSYPKQILRECATVEEVITWVNTHQWHSYMHDQMHFADASGDAVIISAGADGEVVFTRKPLGDSYLVSTNFNVANPSNGYGCCSRFETMESLLEELVKQDNDLNFKDVAGVLDAVHGESAASWTIESMVADLTNGTLYLYYLYQFDRPIVLNIADEIDNARSGGPLSQLFPEDVQQEAKHRLQHIQFQSDFSQIIGKVWLCLVVANLCILFIATNKRREELFFWFLVVLILGPLGMSVWVIVRQKHGSSFRRKVLIEAIGDLSSTVVLFMAYIFLVIYFPSMQATQLSQLLLIFCFPLIIGWLIQGLGLVLTTQRNYLLTTLKRFPHTWVISNLGMAVGMMIAGPLITQGIQFPIQPWNVVSWWAYTVLSAILGLLFILFYETWSLRSGYQGWFILVSGMGEVKSAPLKKVWWWILLSILILFGGLVVYVFFQQVL